MSETKINHGIKCPHCEAEAPDGQFEYEERILSTQRLYFDEDEGLVLGEPEYEHNDPTECYLRCRSCWKVLPVPQAFYDAEPWG